MCRWIAYRGETIPLEHYVTSPCAFADRAEHPGARIDRQHQWRRFRPRLVRRPPGARALSRGPARLVGREPALSLPAHPLPPVFRPCPRRHRNAGDAAELPSVRLRPLDVHAQRIIGDWSRVRRQVEALIPDALYGSRIGTTDSEAVFLAIMGAGGDRDPIGATLRVVRALTRLVNDHNEPLRFTAALADGHNLYAFRYLGQRRGEHALLSDAPARKS